MNRADVGRVTAVLLAAWVTAVLLAGCVHDPAPTGVTQTDRDRVRHCEATWIDAHPIHLRGDPQQACAQETP